MKSGLHSLLLCCRQDEARHSEKHREHDDLGDVSLREGLDDVRGHEVEEHIADLGNIAERIRHGLGELDSAAGLEPSGQAEAQHERDGRRREIEDEDLDTEAAEDACIRQAGDGGEEIEEDERNSGHQEQADEEIAQRLDQGRALSEDEA